MFMQATAHGYYQTSFNIISHVVAEFNGIMAMSNCF